LLQQAACLPQQATLPVTLSWLLVWVALWAIKARAIAKVLRITKSFDFIVSSEFGWSGPCSPLWCERNDARHRRKKAAKWDLL